MEFAVVSVFLAVSSGIAVGAGGATTANSVVGPVPGASQTLDLGAGVTLELVWISPGEFWMGSPDNESGRYEDEIRHRVTLTKGLWIGKYEVTQEQWLRVMAKNPSSFTNAGPRAPVEWITWDECQVFVKRLGEIVNGTNRTDGVFRLPTEAEWEYACRAGTETRFHFGDSLDATMANIDGAFPYGKEGKVQKRRLTTIRVGSFKPNAFGLYDIHGNVREWCLDNDVVYSAEPVVDPKGSGRGVRGMKMCRGGAWNSVAWECRSAFRSLAGSGGKGSDLGVRVVRSQP